MAEAAEDAVAVDEQKLVQQLLTVAKTKQLVAGLDPARLVRETHSARVRDAAALALLDLADPRATELLTDLITREDTRGHRGTLLYVLNELRASVPLNILVDVLIDGPYEAREEALALIEYTPDDSAERAFASKRLKPLTHSEDKELAAAASEAIALLTD